MTASLYQNIRGALQTHLANVSGVPTIAYEGVKFTPTVGTPYLGTSLVPTSARPGPIGVNSILRHQGLFLVDAVYPNGSGTATAEAMADTIKAAFTTQTTLSLNGVDVRISYSERGQIQQEADWLRVPIAIGWYVYSQTY